LPLLLPELAGWEAGSEGVLEAGGVEEEGALEEGVEGVLEAGGSVGFCSSFTTTES